MILSKLFTLRYGSTFLPNLARPILIALACGALLDSQTIVVRNVTLIDMVGTVRRPHTTVVITDGKISAAGEAIRTPAGAQVIDGSGKYLIPGLWDMHVHLRETNPALSAYVAHGITGIRDMGSPFQRTKKLREEIAAGKRIGPRIYTSGSPLEGSVETAEKLPLLRIATPEQARNAVETLNGDGVDFITVLSSVGRDQYESLAQHARVRRIPFAGNVPEDVPVDAAIDLRQRSMEHLSGVVLACSPLDLTLRPQRIKALLERNAVGVALADRRAADTFSETVAARLFRRMALFEVAQCPTLSTLERTALQLKIVRLMSDAGVLLLAGTDTGENNGVPGAALHNELALLVSAGLTPLQALRTATVNPARYFGNEATYGTIARGKVADLVLLSADPLADIRNTKKIVGVILRGRYLDRKRLDALAASAGE